MFEDGVVSACIFVGGVLGVSGSCISDAMERMGKYREGLKEKIYLISFGDS